MDRTAAADPSMPELGILQSAVHKLARTSVLVVGDVMLDRYVYGRVERISPEAPVPILAVEREVALPGGAGNVVRNLTALGAAVAFVSVVGDDQTGSDLTGLVGGQPGVEPWLLVQGARTTTQKTRYMADGQQLLRADQEIAKQIHPKLGERLLRITRDSLAATSVCVLADFGKGLLTGDIPARIIADARTVGRRVIAAPKGPDYARYTGANVAVLTGRDLGQATGLPVETAQDLAAAAAELCGRFAFGAVLAMQARGSMVMVTPDGTHLFPVEPGETIDVSGVMDTVVATLAAALAAKLDLPVAGRLACLAGSVVLGRIGTAVARKADLLAALMPGRNPLSKIVGPDAAAEQVERWRRRGWRTGFMSGAVDAEQPERTVALVEQARAECDRLVFALQPRVDGQSEAAQAAMLARLPGVDLVVSCDDPAPETLLSLFQPEVVVGSSASWADAGLDELVRSWGGLVVRVDEKALLLAAN